MQKVELRYWWEYCDEKTSIVKWKALVDTVGIKSADLEDKFFALVFCGFSNCLDVRKGRKLPYVV